MKEEYFQTLKSIETEDWVDFHLIRPACFHLARLLARFDVHPNTVTILSMFFGAASSVFFAHGSLYYEGTRGLVLNLLAILLLMIADVLDCTDGQLARLTGKKSHVGRILDGIAGFVWFIPIYHALVWRFYLHHSLEFSWLGIADTQQNAIIATAVVYALGLISGFVGMGGQSRLADYYIQVHLFFLKGEEGSELDNSARQQEIYNQLPKDTPLYERWFQKSYVDYTRKQEQATPQFQRLMARLRSFEEGGRRKEEGDYSQPQDYSPSSLLPPPSSKIREEFHRESLALMKWNGLLTFNFRSAFFFLFCLIDLPAMNFVFEIVFMSLLAMYVNRRHEAFSRRLADKL